MFKELKLVFSSANAHTVAMFRTCKECNITGGLVVLNHISKKGYWEYDVQCMSCGKISYSSYK